MLPSSLDARNGRREIKPSTNIGGGCKRATGGQSGFQLA